MSEVGRSKCALWLSFPLAILVAAASLGGVLFPSIYSHEPGLRVAQSLGIDAGNLAAAVPMLVLSAVLALRGSLRALLFWAGMLIYLLYNYLGYAFGLHLNPLFLLYCAIPGLSFYALAGVLHSLPAAEYAYRFAPRAPARTTAAVLLLMATGTVFHWLAEIVPAMIPRQVPQSIRSSGGVPEPAAVLDLAFLAPACAIAAILLVRRRPLGFILAPVLLTFLALSGFGLIPMGIAMELRGFKAGPALYAVAAAFAAVSALLLALSMRPVKPQPNQAAAPIAP